MCIFQLEMVKIRVFYRNSEKMARIGHLVGYGSKWAVFFFYLTPEIDLSNNFGIGKCFCYIGCVFLSDIWLKTQYELRTGGTHVHTHVLRDEHCNALLTDPSREKGSFLIIPIVSGRKEKKRMCFYSKWIQARNRQRSWCNTYFISPKSCKMTALVEALGSKLPV